MTSNWPSVDDIPDATAWEILEAKSQPLAPDLTREHRLHLASWRVVDGGVVVYRYQAFCHCYWSQRWPVSSAQTAIDAWNAHRP